MSETNELKKSDTIELTVIGGGGKIVVKATIVKIKKTCFSGQSEVVFEIVGEEFEVPFFNDTRDENGCYYIMATELLLRLVGEIE